MTLQSQHNKCCINKQFNFTQMETSNENEEEMEEREWVINGFKTFSAVAQEYFPEYSNADTASKRMRNEIELDKLLFDELKAAHYVHETTRLSPKQQQILFMTWGPEKIILR